MTRNEILARLARLKPELIARDRIASLAVFGSVARDEARPDSDVDILVEFDEPPGYFGFVDLQQRLSEELGARVDLFTRASLHPALREKILAEAVDA
jgi:predicted nucleotidyltransferase